MGNSDGVHGRGEPLGGRVETVRGSLLRPDENAIKRWVLLNGNRGVVAVVTLVIAWLGFVAIGTVWTAEITRLFTETGVVETLLVTLLSGIILLVSIAVSINAVVLSQELTSLGTQQERIEDTLTFRNRIRGLGDDDASPARPAEFMQTILRAARGRANDLRATVTDAEPALRDQVDVLADDVVGQADAIDDRLRQGQFGTSDVLLAGLDYDYSWQVYAAQRLQAEPDLADEQERALADLVEILKYFTTGREYFKTLFFKRELANLSRHLLLVAFPAILFLSYMLLALEAGLVPDVSLVGIPSVVFSVGLAYVVGLVPYALFTAYVFRSSTIAKRTLAAGPFILQSEGKRGAIEWDDLTEPE